MNVQQRDLLIELFEKDIQENEALSLALQTYRPEEEYFFKNLENVQGDERDVMVVSVTYGPDRDSGKVFRRFGPIGQNGGERRLNVLFTRARQAMHVFSTMRASDIPPATTESVLAGPEHLRGYLKYAEEGILSDPGQVTDRAPDSPFEEAVLSVLQGMGYQAHAQVGVQGFFIDIGVLVPGATSQYLCGIECDGASYHSDPVSRDRDRLREDILRARGWKIYRIWSTDWWQRRESEIVRLKKYLEGLCGVA